MHVMKKKLQIRTSADESGLLFLVRLCELTDFGYIAREKCTQDCLELLCKYFQCTAMLTIHIISYSEGLCLVTLHEHTLQNKTQTCENLVQMGGNLALQNLHSMLEEKV